MSSYWAGYAGTGLVFKQSEFDEMLKVYMEKNEGEREAVENIEDGGIIDELAFIKSVHAGESMPGLQDDTEKYRDKITHICELTDDNVDGFTFWPFYNPDGKMNVNRELENGDWESAKRYHPIWESGADRCYVSWSKKDMTGPRAFDEKPYESYEAFVNEFKEKWAAYLPEDFNWDAHLGYMSYACYA